MNSGNLEDIYPLSPMQRLFYSVAGAEPEVESAQFRLTLQGNLDIPAFVRAWQRVVDRHSILRTAFMSEGLDKPLQVVHREVKLVLEEQDWRGLSPSEQQRRLDAFLQTDRKRSFDLSQPPLMRLALLRMAEDSYEFLWTQHHIQLDGWSFSLVLKEACTFYDALSQQRELNPERVPLYRDYIAWLQRQNLSAAEAFWREVFQGFTAPTPLPGRGRAAHALPSAENYDEECVCLSAEDTALLNSFASEHHLTMSTLLQGAWALLLSRYSGEAEVVLGVTVSGRPPTLAGVEAMVGLFINNLPLRLTVRPDERAAAWLERVQQRQVDMQNYESTPLVRIQEWSGVPWHLRLFESIVVFQNVSADRPLGDRFGPSVEIRRVSGPARTNYPLTLVGAPGREFSLRLIYDRRRLDREAVREILGNLTILLRGLASTPAQRVSKLLESLPLPPSDPVDRLELPGVEEAAAPSAGSFIAPRDALELQLAKIWEEALRVAPIGVRDNFFELGGHSLLAVRLFAEMEKAFGRSLPLATLFQAPTIEQLAARLREEGWEAPWSSLVVIQGGKDRPPFFCVPGVGGNILGFYDLARELGPDQPVYGLQAQGLDGKREPLTRIEDMAAHYIKEIKAVLPEGPILLGGACFGGSVAFEMGRQLELKGHSVALLALFDAPARGGGVSSPWLSVARRRLKSYRVRFAYHGKNLLFGSERSKYIRAKSRTLRRRIRSRIWQMIYNAYRGRSKPLPRVLQDVREAGYLANKEYFPQPYGGKVTLFRAKVRSIVDSRRLDMGWGRLAVGGVEIREVPGDHVDMLMPPQVGLLAEQLRDCIDKAIRVPSPTERDSQLDAGLTAPSRASL